MRYLIMKNNSQRINSNISKGNKKLLTEASPPPFIDTAAMFRQGGQLLGRSILKVGGSIALGYLLDSAVDLSGNQQVWLDRHRLEINQATDQLQLAVKLAIREYADEGNLRLTSQFIENNPRINFGRLVSAVTPLMMMVAEGHRSPTWERLLKSDYHEQFGVLKLPHRVGIMFLKAVCLNSKSPDIFARQMSYENISGPAPYYSQCSSSRARCMLTVWGVFYESMKSELTIARNYCNQLDASTFKDVERYRYDWHDSCFMPPGNPAPAEEPVDINADVFWGGSGGAERSPPEREEIVDNPDTPDNEARPEQFPWSHWKEIETCKGVRTTYTETVIDDIGDRVTEDEIGNAVFQLDLAIDALEEINAAVVLKNRAVASTAPLVGIIDSGIRGTWNNSLGELAVLIPGIENEDVIMRDECQKLPGTLWDEDGVMDYGHR